MFVYCKKCGTICSSTKHQGVCDVCDSDMFDVPREYLTASGLMFVSQEKRKEFENVIRQNDDYDEEIAKNREIIVKEKEAIRAAEIAEKIDSYNKTRMRAQCPVCHSTSLDKISNVGKVVKVGVFGILGAGDIGKKYKCKACGYRF